MMTDEHACAAAEGNVDGWFHHGSKILELIDQHRPKVCVELGTWMGASAIPVARSVRRWRGTLTCVDVWLGSPHHEPGRVGDPPWMLASCARNMMQAGVQGTIRLIPCTTAEAARWWTTPIDYLYIDADHAYESALEDLRAWVPHVTPGGLIVGDDYDNQLYPGVKVAFDQYEQESGLQFTRYQSDPPCIHGIQLIHGIKSVH